MPRSPSPQRGYRRDPPSRPPYRDRPFRLGQAGPSRYNHNQSQSQYDEDRGGGAGRPGSYGTYSRHERDQGPYDRNKGRTWGNYNNTRREDGGYGYRGGRSRSRSRDRSVDRRSRSRSTDDGRGPRRITDDRDGGARAGSPRPVKSVIRDVRNDSSRASQASRSNSPPRSRIAASASPEEGQITSPKLPARSLAARLGSPAPSSQGIRRSPSPLPRERVREPSSPPRPRDRWDDRDRHHVGEISGRDARDNRDTGYREPAGDRDRGEKRYGDRPEYTRGRGGYGVRGRGGFYRDRETRGVERDNGWGGNRNFNTSRQTRSRSPLPPPSRGNYTSRRSRSPSTTSSYRSSRYTSPDKRRSPLKRERDWERERDYSRSPLPPSRDRDRSPEGRWREGSTERKEEQDRRGSDIDRNDIPTPPPPASESTAVPRPPRQQQPQLQSLVTPTIRRPPAGPRSDRIPSGPRGFIPPLPPPSIPPITSSNIRDARDTRASDPTSPPPPPPPPPISTDPPPPTSSPSTSHSGIPRLSWSERKKIVSPNTPSFPESVQSPISYHSNEDPKPRSGPTISTSTSGYGTGTGLNPYSQNLQLEGGDLPRRDTARSPIYPASNQSNFHRPYSRGSMHGGMEPEAASSSPTSRPRTPPPPVAAAAAVLSEEEIAERKRKEEEARIVAELPGLKVGYIGGNWEREVNRHYATLQPIETTTQRAQAGLRMARSILADVELERAAASERRAVCEGQLLKATSGLGILGGV